MKWAREYYQSQMEYLNKFNLNEFVDLNCIPISCGQGLWSFKNSDYDLFFKDFFSNQSVDVTKNYLPLISCFDAGKHLFSVKFQFKPKKIEVCSK